MRSDNSVDFGVGWKLVEEYALAVVLLRLVPQLTLCQRPQLELGLLVRGEGVIAGLPHVEWQCTDALRERADEAVQLAALGTTAPVGV